MAKWDCFTRDGFFVGIVEADSADEAFAECADTRAIIPHHVIDRETGEKAVSYGQD